MTMELLLILEVQAGIYWVPVDKYVVRAKPDEYIPLTDELYTVRCMVLEGRFKERTVPTISYAKLHAFMIGASSSVKKAPGCKCKKGKSGKSCGCRKKEKESELPQWVRL